MAKFVVSQETREWLQEQIDREPNIKRKMILTRDISELIRVIESIDMGEVIKRGRDK